MNSIRWTFRVLPDFLVAIGVGLLSALVAAVAMGYSQVPLTIPSGYDGDGLFYGMLIKGVAENGWYLFNPNLGAPFGLDMSSFPMADDSHFTLLKLLSLAPESWASSYTLFYLFSFVTAAVSAYSVMRNIGINRAFASCGGLLFSLQAYHFIRGAHLFLASYFCIPIFFWLAFKVHQATADFKSNWLLTALLIAMVIAISGCGIYYAIFGCILIAFSAVSGSIEKLTWRPLLTSAILGILILIGVSINLTPYFLANQTRDGASSVAARSPQESEFLGLRLTQLALPSPAHPNRFLNGISKYYDDHAPNVNENWSASIGIVALIGFVLSLSALLFLFNRPKFRPLIFFGSLNLIAFAFGTIGGVGAIIAWTAFPMIRGWNRISIVIAFVSLCGLFWVLQHISNGIRSRKLQTAFSICVSVPIGLFGMWDEVPYWEMPMAVRNQAPFQQDEESGKALMRALPSNASVYQMPYIQFPEGAVGFREGGYGLAKRFLHTRGISWSYGAMREREGDNWIKALEALPLRTRIEKLAGSGFTAILVERNAFSDSGRELESQLSNQVGPPTQICPDQSCALFRIDQSTPLHSTPFLLAIRGQGFGESQAGAVLPTDSLSMFDTDARILLLNPLKDPVLTRLRFKFESRDGTPISATLGEDERVNWSLSSLSNGQFDEVIELPAGISALKFRFSSPSKSNVRSDLRASISTLKDFSISAETHRLAGRDKPNQGTPEDQIFTAK